MTDTEDAARHKAKMEKRKAVQDAEVAGKTMEKGLLIVNTGPGIGPEAIDHIFERFYKGDRSRGSKVTSSGLGLYIVKTLVGRHGGDIYAKSGDGQTEFCFTIPTSL